MEMRRLRRLELFVGLFGGGGGFHVEICLNFRWNFV
jgi:hypothetical protein